MKGVSAGEASPLLFWLGLAWVWANFPWLVVTMVQFGTGETAAGVRSALHLLISLATGIGLCAGERRGWAAAVCISVLYAVACVSAACAAAWQLMNLPTGVLSWEPLLFGMNLRGWNLTVGWGSLLGIVAMGIAGLLWSQRDHFDVPERRSFTTLARFGLVPATVQGLIDLWMALEWLVVSSR